MKNSKEYAKKIEAMFRSLKKKSAKVRSATYTDPIDILVYAVIGKHLRTSAARKSMKNIKEHFVDINDLRVSRTEEILEAIEGNDKAAKQVAKNLPEVLNALFAKFDSVSMESLAELGKRQARKELEEIEHFSRFIVDYCFLTSMGGHAFPVTEIMADYLRGGNYVHPKAKDDEIASFLERQVSAANAYEFYVLLRRQSEASRKKTPKAKAAKKKTTTKKKTVKKKTVKKKVKKKKSKAKKK